MSPPPSRRRVAASENLTIGEIGEIRTKLSGFEQVARQFRAERAMIGGCDKKSRHKTSENFTTQLPAGPRIGA
jgi:hypothetical protein